MSKHQRQLGSSSKNNKQQLVDWTNLPVELLDVILGMLFNVGDYVRFGAVCKSWNFVAMDQKQKRIASVTQQPPMLLSICPSKYDLENYFQSGGWFKREVSTVYSIGEGRFYKNLQLGATDEVVLCLGCSYGWVAIQKKKRRTITLFNPFNQKSMTIPVLPKRYGVIHKIIMSSDPSISSNDFIIAAISVSIDNNFSQELAWFVPGKKSWNIISHLYLEVGEFRKVEDIIFYQGRLYAVDIRLRLIAIDFPRSFPQDEQYPEFNLEIIIAENQFEQRRLDMLPAPRSFLVEASNGNLVVVQGDFLGPFFRPYQLSFQIFKLEIKNEKGKSRALWVQILELDNNDAIFVAENSCFCIDARSSDPEYCSPNSIYFAFNLKDRRYIWQPFEAKVFKISRIGVYNLSDGTLRDLDDLRGIQRSMLPIGLLHPQLS